MYQTSNRCIYPIANFPSRHHHQSYSPDDFLGRLLRGPKHMLRRLELGNRLMQAQIDLEHAVASSDEDAWLDAMRREQEICTAARLEGLVR